MTDPAIMRKADLIAEAMKLKAKQNNVMDSRALRKFESSHPSNHEFRAK
jgi:hypothetical protein